MGTCPVGAAAGAATSGVDATAVGGTVAYGAEDEVIVGIGGEAGNGVGRGGDADGLASALRKSLRAVFTDEGVDAETLPEYGGGVLGDVDDFDVGGKASFDAEVVEDKFTGREAEGDAERGLGVGERVDGNDGCVVEPCGGELGVDEGKGVERDERRGVGDVGDDAYLKQRAATPYAGPEVDVDLLCTLRRRAEERGDSSDAVGGIGVEAERTVVVVAVGGGDGARGAVGIPTLPLVGIAPVVEGFEVVAVGDADRRMGGGEGDGAIGAVEGVAVALWPEMKGMCGSWGEATDDGGRRGGQEACAAAGSELVAYAVFHPERLLGVPMDPHRGVLLV